jgi:hypothetical protein
MKTSNALRPLAIAAILAGILTIAPAGRAEDAERSSVLSRPTELLGGLLKAVAAAGQEAVGGMKADGAGLKTSGLRTSTLETSTLATGTVQRSAALPGSAIGSAAVGLTPVEQWRVLFPEKKQTVTVGRIPR